MNILVLASGFAPQYRVLRCAAATGATVYILGDKRAVWLGISRYCRKFVDWQAGWDVAAPSVIAALNDIIAEHTIDCVVPSDALTTRFLSLVRKELQCKTFPVPDTQAFDQLNTKDAFAKLCARLEIPHPSTRVVANRQELFDLHARGELRFPIIAKPINRSGSYGVVKLEKSDFEQKAAQIDYEPVLVQDFVAGVDLCISLYCEDGETKTSLTYRGLPGVFHFFHNEKLDALTRQVAKSLRLSGVINFDARATPDGDIYLIECNPRFWYNMDIALVAGINFLALGLGVRGEGATRPPAIAPSVRLPSGLARALLKPAGLKHSDFSMFGFYSRDPLVYAYFQAHHGIKWLQRRIGESPLRLFGRLSWSELGFHQTAKS